jgi:small subunit ribosomal protein S13
MNLNLFIKKKLGSNQRINYNFILEKKTIIKNKILKKALNGSESKIKTKRSIDFLKKLKTFKGLRHKNNLPTRGQRTRTNAKTSKKKLQKI